MNIWFTADEHYGHRNIIKFCKRPFDDLAGMREELIRRHNMLVEPGDIVHHVGDMFWRTLSDDEAVAILSRLNGDHFYVLGNHEEVVNNSLLVQRAFFDIKERRHIVPPKGPQKGIVLDHYSGRVWHQSDKGSWQLYGHSHGELPEDDGLLSFDVGVDANDYFPVSLDEVIARIGEKVKRVQRKLDGAKAQ